MAPVTAGAGRGTIKCLAPRFGISTHLFHGQRLTRDHLVAVAAHHFELLEVYATRTHFDYHDPAGAAALAEWLDDTRLTLHAVHAPTTLGYSGGRWGATLSIAAPEEEHRQAAVRETIAALALASVVQYAYLVVHLGVPDADGVVNSRASVARSLETIAAAAGKAGVTLALELIPNALSRASRLVQWIEEDLDLNRAGICLDVGHAHVAGDAMDAVEACSGHIVTTHLHDNRGVRDEHLLPGRGTVDWEGVILAFQKVGYDGAWMLELAPAPDPAAVLREAAAERRRLEALMIPEL